MFKICFRLDSVWNIALKALTGKYVICFGSMHVVSMSCIV